jgi:probable F420-dependent oxidoreductase
LTTRSSIKESNMTPSNPPTASEISGLGVWSWLDALSASEAAACTRRIEAWGYSALWIPEAVGRDPFALLAHLAANTDHLILATGIAGIYSRDAMTMRAAQQTVGEMAPGRFILGLGVSHAPMVTGVRGHEYRPPVTAMREYLEAMEKATYLGPRPDPEVPILLAALRPKMLGLAARRARGAHPYFVTPDHTRKAREILGPDALLCPEQKVLLESDPAVARRVARAAMQIYVGLPNYRNSLLTQGFDESDFENGGSDRLVDGIVAWGDEQAIADRIQAHRDAGANHVCIQPLRPDGGPGPDERALEAMAPVSR